MATNINTIKNWFKTASKPTQDQFWAWMDSYWHKDEKLSIGAIERLSEILGSKADADQLVFLAQKDGSNIDIEQWKTLLGVGELPENVLTYDMPGNPGNGLTKEEIAQQYLKKPTFIEDLTAYNRVPLLNAKNETAYKDADSFGKNVANSNPTSIPNAGLTLGAPWTLATAGQPYAVTGLPNKSADATYNRFRVQDSTGKEAYTTGIKQLTTNMAASTDAEKDAWRIAIRKSNEAYSVGQPVINVISPPILNKNVGYAQPIAFIGSNLFVDNVTPTAIIKLVRVKDENDIIIPQERYDVTAITTVAQNLPNQLVIVEDFSSYPLGKYKAEVTHNGITSLSSFELEVVNEISQTPIPVLSVTDSIGNATLSDNSLSILGMNSGIKIGGLGNMTDYPNGLMLEFNVILKGIPVSNETYYRGGSNNIYFDISNTYTLRNIIPTDNGFVVSFPYNFKGSNINIGIANKIIGIPTSVSYKVMMIIRKGFIVLYSPTYGVAQSKIYTNLNELFIYLTTDKENQITILPTITLTALYKF